MTEGLKERLDRLAKEAARIIAASDGFPAFKHSTSDQLYKAAAPKDGIESPFKQPAGWEGHEELFEAYQALRHAECIEESEDQDEEERESETDFDKGEAYYTTSTRRVYTRKELRAEPPAYKPLEHGCCSSDCVMEYLRKASG